MPRVHILFTFIVLLECMNVAERKAILLQMLNDCFDIETLKKNGVPRNAEFGISGKDDFRNVNITFTLDSQQSLTMCKLEWTETFSKMYGRGKIISTRLDNGQPVENNMLSKRYYAEDLTGVEILIHGEYPYSWKVGILYPNNLVSGRFIRAFMNEGIKAHTDSLTRLEKFRGDKVSIILSDTSTIRELYWLEKGHGKTYYQKVWELEYTCLVEDYSTRLEAYYQRIQTLDKITPAHHVLLHADWSYLQNAQQENIVFEKEFIREVTRWNATKTFAEIHSMTIRQAIDGLLPGLKRVTATDEYNFRQVLFQNLVVFFFRKDPDWDIIARQVIYGFDDDCTQMYGFPPDEESPTDFTFTYTPKFQKTSTASGTSQNENRLATSFLAHKENLFLSFFFLLTFSISTCIIFLHQPRKKILHQEFYMEL